MDFSAPLKVIVCVYFVCFSWNLQLLWEFVLVWFFNCQFNVLTTELFWILTKLSKKQKRSYLSQSEFSLKIQAILREKPSNKFESAPVKICQAHIDVVFMLDFC